MQFLVMLVALAACTRSGEGPPSGVVTDRLTGARSMEITEPWKSMNLPIDGAIVDVSTTDSLILRFPTLKAEDARPAHAALRQGLIDAGWEIGRKGDDPPGPWSYFTTPEGNRAKLTTGLEDGRPASRIGVAP